MTKIVCETAVLADAIGKASRVAPNKGAAFDKAQGILLEVKPDRPSPLYVKATNLETTYLQRIPVIAAEGEAVDWRLPAPLFAGIMASLPLGAGQNVTLEAQGEESITITAGRKRADVRQIASHAFPTIKPFDPAGMASVDDLAKRIEQASWATDDNSEVLCGVHIDGNRVLACDRVSLVLTDCKVPVETPITVPFGGLGPLLRNVGTVQMRATDKRLELMTDADTQITSIILMGKYPKVDAIRREDFEGKFRVSSESLSNAINSMLVLVRGERYPMLHIRIEANELALDMEVAETGKMEDTIEVDGGATGGPGYEIWLTPQNLLNAISHARRDEVEISYGPTPSKPLRITDADEYECWVMPMQPPTT